MPPKPAKRIAEAPAQPAQQPAQPPAQPPAPVPANENPAEPNAQENQDQEQDLPGNPPMEDVLPDADRARPDADERARAPEREIPAAPPHARQIINADPQRQLREALQHAILAYQAPMLQITDSHDTWAERLRHLIQEKTQVVNRQNQITTINGWSPQDLTTVQEKAENDLLAISRALQAWRDDCQPPTLINLPRAPIQDNQGRDIRGDWKDSEKRCKSIMDMIKDFKIDGKKDVVKYLQEHPERYYQACLNVQEIIHASDEEMFKALKLAWIGNADNEKHWLDTLLASKPNLKFGKDAPPDQSFKAEFMRHFVDPHYNSKKIIKLFSLRKGKLGNHKTLATEMRNAISDLGVDMRDEEKGHTLTFKSILRTHILASMPDEIQNHLLRNMRDVNLVADSEITMTCEDMIYFMEHFKSDGTISYRKEDSFTNKASSSTSKNNNNNKKKGADTNRRAETTVPDCKTCHEPMPQGLAEHRKTCKEETEKTCNRPGCGGKFKGDFMKNHQPVCKANTKRPREEPPRVQAMDVDEDNFTDEQLKEAAEQAAGWGDSPSFLANMEMADDDDMSDNRRKKVGGGSKGILIPLIIQDHLITDTLLDTGATTCSFMSQSLVEKLGIGVEKKDGIINLANMNMKVDRIGKTEPLPVISSNGSCIIVFEVMKDLQHDVIIGLPDLPKIGVEIAKIPTTIPKKDESDSFLQDKEDIQLYTDYLPDIGRLDEKHETMLMKRIERVLETNGTIPTGSVCNLPQSVVKLDIDETNTGMFIRQYKTPHAMIPEVDKQVDEWEATGVIEPVTTRSQYNSPLLAVADKKDGQVVKVRVVLDPRHINKLIKPVNYPIPLISEVFEKLAGAKYFTTLDLARSFHQFELDQESRKYTAFTWKDKQWQFKATPFGLKPISAIFQQTMADVLRTVLAFVALFIDDIIIFSETLEEHVLQVKKVITLLNEANLKLNPKKCHFFRTRIQVLGHEISHEGIRISRNKLTDHHRFVLPSTGKEIEQDLGFFNFFRSFIPNYAQLTAPLEKLRKEGSLDGKFTDEHKEIYTILKNVLFSDTVLSFPDWTRPFFIATDASNHGVGAVLYQEDDNGNKKFINFASSALNKGQKNYPAMKKELFALVFALMRFREYIWGTKFTLFTDHRALAYLHTVGATSPMLSNWFNIIFEYDFEIIHKPGILNIIPDRISRFYCRVANTKDEDTDPEIATTRVRNRVDNPRNDWKLNPSLFHKLDQLWGRHSIDAFASDINAQLPRYYTFEDNAFDHSWEGENLWMNPPWPLINKVVDKLIEDKATATIITPGYEKKEWFKKLRALSIAEPIRLPHEKNTFLPVSKANSEGIGIPEWEYTLAWRVSGVYGTETGKHARWTSDQLKFITELDFTAAHAKYLAGAKKDSRLRAKVEVDTIMHSLAAVSTEEASFNVPLPDRSTAIQRAHLSGHFGAKAMYDHLRHNELNWKGMLDDCLKEAASCSQCTKYTVKRHGYFPLKSIHADLPFDHIAIDLAGEFTQSTPEGYVYLLVVVDVATRFTFLRPLKNKKAETISDALFRIFTDVGFPKIIQSDNGGEFIAEMVENWIKKGQIDHRLISSYHPRANGLAERFVQTAKQTIYKLVEGRDDQWAIKVPSVQYYMNNKVAAIHKSTPYSLMFGRPQNLFRDYKDVQEREPTEAEMLARLDMLTSMVYPEIKEKSMAHAQHENDKKDTVKQGSEVVRRKIVGFPNGSWVYTIDPTRTAKSQPKYLGPYQVVRRNTGGAYELQDANGNTFVKPPEHLKQVIRTAEETNVTRYNAKAILDHRGDENHRQFCIEWFTDEDKRQESWVSAEKIENPKMIQDYWRKVQHKHVETNKPILSEELTKLILEQKQAQEEAKTKGKGQATGNPSGKSKRSRKQSNAGKQPNKKQKLIVKLKVPKPTQA